jgi:hypothetical protein
MIIKRERKRGKRHVALIPVKYACISSEQNVSLLPGARDLFLGKTGGMEHDDQRSALILNQMRLN